MTLWQPMETAPFNGERVLLLRKNMVVCGYFNSDKNSKRPLGYWSHDLERIFGTRDARMYSPIGWMYLSEASLP